MSITCVGMRSMKGWIGYPNRYGYYPERVLADPLYGTRANRAYLKQRGIPFAGKPLGRPQQVTEANQEQLKQAQAQRRQDYLQRIPIEGKFGQGKNGYRLNYIRAKRANTSFAWISSLFLVMNLLILERIFFVLSKWGFAGFMDVLKRTWGQLCVNLRVWCSLPTQSCQFRMLIY